MTFQYFNQFFKSVVTLISVLLLAACSQSNNVSSDSNLSSNIDPYERTNRRIFKFNTGLDTHLVRPVAKAYKKVTPDVVENGVNNFFNNLKDVGSTINNLLQFKLGPALMDSERVLFNSTIGLAGVFDVATALDIERYEEDFGQTLAHWGVESGPYVMLPFLGPSTVRDATAKLTIDSLTNPANYHEQSLALFALDKIDQRADFFSDEEAFKDISDDSYAALRDLWLQRRSVLVNDGKVSEEEQSNLIDELESLDDE